VTEQIGIIVPNGTSRTRLEDFLFERFPGLSRMYLRGVVRDERCEVNGRFENVGFRVRGGDFIEVELDPTRENSMRPENVPLDIILEDEHLVVVNKPAGMLVHPTNRDKNGTLLNALVYHLNAESRNAECGVRSAASGNAECEVRSAESKNPSCATIHDKHPFAESGLTNSSLRDPHS
jgi:23S rRNA-/tRNA-specific pseudouridylate synthase